MILAISIGVAFAFYFGYQVGSDKGFWKGYEQGYLSAKHDNIPTGPFKFRRTK